MRGAAINITSQFLNQKYTFKAKLNASTHLKKLGCFHHREYILIMRKRWNYFHQHQTMKKLDAKAH
jgi:hypothetical protein